MFQVPNTLRRLLAEGAFSAALVPALARQRDPRGPGRVGTGGVRAAARRDRAADRGRGARRRADHPHPRRLSRTREDGRCRRPLFRVMVPYAALAGGGRGAHGRPARTRCVRGAGARAAAVLGRRDRLRSGVGAVLGHIRGRRGGHRGAGVLHFLFQVPFFVRRGFSMVPRLRFDDRMRRILRGWGPAGRVSPWCSRPCSRFRSCLPAALRTAAPVRSSTRWSSSSSRWACCRCPW